MAWNFKPNGAIYLQIVSIIKSRIYSGQYKPGEYLPTVRELAQEVSVNPNTVQKAFAELEESGLICTNRTVGRMVTDDCELIRRSKEDTCKAAVSSFMEEMSTMGLSREDIIYVLNGSQINLSERKSDI